MSNFCQPCIYVDTFICQEYSSVIVPSFLFFVHIFIMFVLYIVSFDVYL